MDSMRRTRPVASLAMAATIAGAVALVPAAEPAQARGTLDKRPFNVVAVVDTGINPYHIDFRIDQTDSLRDEMWGRLPTPLAVGRRITDANR